MSSRYERRRGSAGGAVLLLIAAAALVVAILAICTDVFSGKKAPDKDADTPPVTQTDGENTGDGTQSGDKQDTTGDTDNTDADNAGDGKSDVTTTKPASSNVITTSDKPYQSGGVYVVGSAGYEMYNYVGSLAEKYQSTVNAVADSLSGVSQVYAMAIPLSSGITLPDELFSDIPGSDQAQAEKDILAGMGQNVKTIPLHDVMMSHRTEYIYFRTDHHWTARGAYYAYRAFCAEAGLTPRELDSWKRMEFAGFLGTLYSEAGRPSALGDTPDTVEAWIPSGTNKMTVYPVKGDATGQYPVIQTATDRYYAAAGSKYNCFIAGDNPLSVIENPDAERDEAIVVVKESFGNAFVPFLVDTYRTVYVVDYRTFRARMGVSLPAFVAEKGASTVLFLNNMTATSAAERLSEMEGILK